MGYHLPDHDQAADRAQPSPGPGSRHPVEERYTDAVFADAPGARMPDLDEVLSCLQAYGQTPVDQIGSRITVCRLVERAFLLRVVGPEQSHVKLRAPLGLDAVIARSGDAKPIAVHVARPADRRLGRRPANFQHALGVVPAGGKVAHQDSGHVVMPARI